jgi:hypothetical protein
MYYYELLFSNFSIAKHDYDRVVFLTSCHIHTMQQGVTRVHTFHLVIAKPPVESDYGTDAEHIVKIKVAAPHLRDVVDLHALHAAVPRATVPFTKRASKPATVTVVLVFKDRLCAVYLGTTMGESTRSSLVPGTVTTNQRGF